MSFFSQIKFTVTNLKEARERVEWAERNLIAASSCVDGKNTALDIEFYKKQLADIVDRIKTIESAVEVYLEREPWI